MAQEKLRPERCLPYTARPPGIDSQAPVNRGSDRVISCIRGTRGTIMSVRELSLSPLKEALQEVTPSRSKQPEVLSNTEAGQSKDKPKDCVGYSGAARRRYKKQQRERKAAKATTPNAAASNPRVEEQSAPPGAVKRTRPVHDTLSLLEGRQGKRPV